MEHLGQILATLFSVITQASQIKCGTGLFIVQMLRTAPLNVRGPQ